MMFINECCPTVHLCEYSEEHDEILGCDFFNAEASGEELLDLVSKLSKWGAKLWEDRDWHTDKSTPYVLVTNGYNTECKIMCPTNIDAINLFLEAKAYVNSMECNHDQLDRNEGVL